MHYPDLLRREQGFTLLELMVGLGITAFLLLMSLPSAKTYLVDTKIRTAAQSYRDGAQLARAEALRRNGDATISLTGGSWTVTASGETVASQAAESASALTVSPATLSITFDSMGQATQDSTVQFMASGGDCSGQRCLNVAISRGGLVRLCDPDPTLSDGDNRKC